MCETWKAPPKAALGLPGCLNRAVLTQGRATQMLLEPVGTRLPIPARVLLGRDAASAAVSTHPGHSAHSAALQLLTQPALALDTAPASQSRCLVGEMGRQQDSPQLSLQMGGCCEGKVQAPESK